MLANGIGDAFRFNLTGSPVSAGRLVLALLLAVQVTDISGPILERHNRFIAPMEHTAYDDATLDALVATGNFSHISFTSNRTENLSLMYTMAEYSLRHDLTINMFYVAHDARLSDAIDMVLEELPPITEQEEWCEMTAEDRVEYGAQVLAGSFPGMRRVAFLQKDLSSSSKAVRLAELCAQARDEG